MSIICNPNPIPNPAPIDLNSTHIFRRLTKNFDGIELHSRNYSTFHIKKANHHIAMSGSETRFRTTQPTNKSVKGWLLNILTLLIDAGI